MFFYPHFSPTLYNRMLVSALQNAGLVKQPAIYKILELGEYMSCSSKFTRYITNWEYWAAKTVYKQVHFTCFFLVNYFYDFSPSDRGAYPIFFGQKNKLGLYERPYQYEFTPFYGIKKYCFTEKWRLRKVLRYVAFCIGSSYTK